MNLSIKFTIYILHKVFVTAPIQFKIFFLSFQVQEDFAAEFSRLLCFSIRELCLMPTSVLSRVALCAHICIHLPYVFKRFIQTVYDLYDLGPDS
jgi:hypothetical protein